MNIKTPLIVAGKIIAYTFFVCWMALIMAISIYMGPR
jgi:hypothetical protein